MCYVCEIDNSFAYEGTIKSGADVAFADQFKAEFRDLVRHEFSDWLAKRGMTVVIDEATLAAYDALFMLGAQVCLRLLNHHELLLMLDERE